MTLIELPELVQGSDEWLEQRRGMVTASVVGKLLTATGRVADNDYSRALTALLVAERITGYSDPVFVNDDMMRGHECEPLAVAKYEEHYGRTVRTTGFLIREEPGWRLGYSPDGLVGDDGLVEVKAPRSKKHLLTILRGDVPPEHMPQIQAGLLVTGREWLDFISYWGGMPMWTKRVEPDPKWFDAITEAVIRFEETAAQMVSQYRVLTEHLPMTDRINFEDLVI